MDEDPSRYGPLALWATVFASAAAVVKFIGPGKVPDFNTTSPIIQHPIVEHWDTDFMDLEPTISRRDNIINIFIVLCLLLVNLLIPTFCALDIAKKLRGFNWRSFRYVIFSRILRFTTRFTLYLLTFLALWALWAAIEPRDQTCCGSSGDPTIYTVLVILLFGLVWTVSKLRSRGDQRRIRYLIVGPVLVVLVLLALWQMRKVQHTACYRYECSPKAKLIPILFLVVVWIAKKLYFWTPRRYMLSILRRFLLVTIFVLILWLIMKPRMQALYCCLWNQTLCLMLLMLGLLAPWRLQVRAYHGLFPSIVIKFIPPPACVVTLLLLRAAQGVQQSRGLDPNPAVSQLLTREEEHMLGDQTREIKRLSSLVTDQSTQIQRLKHTLATECIRLKLKLALKMTKSKTASLDSAAAVAVEITRLSRRYDNLVTSTLNAIDPNGIYHHGESIEYVIRRVKERMAQAKQDLERRETALVGSDVVQAAQKGKEEAEKKTNLLKAEHDSQLKALKDDAIKSQSALEAKEKELQQLSTIKDRVRILEHDATKVHSALESKEKDLEQLSAAKTKVEERTVAEKAGLQTTIDESGAALSKAEQNILKLETSVDKSDSQLIAANSMINALKSQVVKVEESKQQAEESLRVKTQEFDTRIRTIESSHQSHVNDITAAKNDLETKLQKSEAANKLSEVQFKAHVQALEGDLKKEKNLCETTKRAALEQEQMKKAHADTLASKGQEIEYLQGQVAELSSKNYGHQHSSSGDMDVDKTADSELHRKVNEVSKLSADLAAERFCSHALDQRVQELQRDADQRTQQSQQAFAQNSQLQQSLDHTTRDLQLAIQQLHSSEANKGYTHNLEEQLNAAKRTNEDLNRTYQSTQEALSVAQKQCLEASAEIERQKNTMEMANKTTDKAQQSAIERQRVVEEQQVIIVTLKDGVQKMEQQLRVVAAAQEASEAKLTNEPSNFSHHDVANSTTMKPVSFGAELANHGFGFDCQQPAIGDQQPLSKQQDANTNTGSTAQETFKLMDEVNADYPRAAETMSNFFDDYNDDGSYKYDIMNGRQYNFGAYEDPDAFAVPRSNGYVTQDSYGWERHNSGGNDRVDWADAWPTREQAEPEPEWSDFPKLSEEEEATIQQRIEEAMFATMLNDADEETLSQRPLRKPQGKLKAPTSYDPSQPLFDWATPSYGPIPDAAAQISLYEAYNARHSLEADSSALSAPGSSGGFNNGSLSEDDEGHAGKAMRLDPSLASYSERARKDEDSQNSWPNKDETDVAAAQPQSIDDILAALASTAPADLPLQQQPPQAPTEAEQVCPPPAANPPQKRRRVRFED